MKPTRTNRNETTLVPRSKDHKQVSLMHVFRSAVARKDARDAATNFDDGARKMTERSKERREGTDEVTLRHHLTGDLASLMNTINLAACEDLSDVPFVERSILNFGFDDLSQMDDSEHAAREISALIHETLLNYEPRLIAETIEINSSNADTTNSRRMAFDISAEMVATPVDIPLEFVAEVDHGAGKIQMTRLKVQT
jgi:type VI secretion system protein ImpF